MELSSDVLNKLVCYTCNGHLSRGPILMLDDGKSKCGRCAESLEGTRRNVPYEELAKYMAFPCRYKGEGCQEKVIFEENQKHEEVCPFRPFVCPIKELEQCKWLGKYEELLTHCRTEHPDTVIQNYFKFRYNIVRSNVCTYVLCALKVLFLVQIKVCSNSRKIYHSVFLLDDTRSATQYKFNVNIECKEEKINKQGNVVPGGCLDLERDTTLQISIDSMLDILGTIRDTICTLTVRSVEKKSLERMQVVCAMCRSLTAPEFEQSPQLWLCESCIPTKRTCKNRCDGCMYTDFANKCAKHEQYFCKFNNQCLVCKMNIRSGHLDEHYKHAHVDITYNASSEFRIRCTSAEQWCVIDTDFGSVLCKYSMVKYNFVVYVYTPLPSDQLHRYRCVMELSQSRKRCKNTLDMQYSGRSCDWRFNVPYSAYKTIICDNKCNMKINFKECIP